MQILDCTLRDGANVVGKGFSAELTKLILEGLIESNINVIEMGNCLGVGAYEANNSISPLNDLEYMELAQPYLDKAEIGMFIGQKNANERNIELAASKGIKFLRIGANAGDGRDSEEAIKLVKKYGMKARYALMKAYILSSKDLADEAKRLESYGLDEITIMDSAGTMLPLQVKEYVETMVNAVNIPVGFHGHNNLGLAAANSIVAVESGASSIDCGLMGMARSAGNLPTEVAIAVFNRMGMIKDIDFYKLLKFIDEKLAPKMEEYNYKAYIQPIDLVFGYAGCHSSFAGIFETVAKEKDVELYPLIVEASKINKKLPTEDLIQEVADKMKKL
ncbi:MAG: 4-hydroxy-2-oxovalerate aldolase [Tissierellia bacterium]|nr:4-hydroxy-2-oxovalerate aldolase [Tissierellia bacterium]